MGGTPQPPGSRPPRFHLTTAMSTPPTHTPASTYRVLVTDQLTPGLAEGQSRHYESPPQTEQQARDLLGILVGPASHDHPGPWRQAIAGGQRIIELSGGS